MTRNWQQKKPE